MLYLLQAMCEVDSCLAGEVEERCTQYPSRLMVCKSRLHG
jgi:hypothetical protein